MSNIQKLVGRYNIKVDHKLNNRAKSAVHD